MLIFYKIKTIFLRQSLAYEKLLIEQRALAKTNPKVYNIYMVDTLNNLAVLYSDNNQMKKAEESYIEALRLYITLAKINPNVYNTDSEDTLNNLAILYKDYNQTQKTKEAYGEALTLYRALAKTNPKIYGIDLANSLVMGVYLLNQPSINLDEAEAILQKFSGIPKAEQLLGLIEKLPKR